MITGSIASNGITVTLDAGNLVPSWITAGAQVSGYKDGSTVFVKVGYGTSFSPYGTLLPSSRIPSIASIAGDKKSFTLTTDSATGQPFTAGTVLTGVRFYFGQLWVDAMNNGVWQNCNAKPPTNTTKSIGVGFFGADTGDSVNMPGLNKTMWLYSDTYWTTGAGGNRSSKNTFIHNSIAIQEWAGSSPDLSVDTVTFYSGQIDTTDSDGTPRTTYTSAIHHFPPADWIWPEGGLYRSDGTLLILGGRVSDNGNTGVGGLCILVINPYDAPKDWIITEIPTPFGEYVGGMGGSGLFLEGSYYYTVGGAWGNGNRSVIVTRFPKGDIEASVPTLMNAEWWCGNNFGWVGRNPYDPDFPINDQFKPFLAGSGYTIPDSQSTLHKNHNGDWLLTQGEQFSTPAGIRMRNLGSSLANLNLTDNEVLSNYGDLIYFPPSDVAVSSGNNIWLYSCKAHPEQTWSGQGAGEIVVTYANNIFEGGAYAGNYGPAPDNANYWVQTLRVAGL
jgi:hypothetical protein